MRTLARNARTWLRTRDPFDLASVALLVAVVVLIFVTYQAYAISNDEEVQQRYGEMILRYYVSGFRDQSLFHFFNLYLYGGLFDIVAVFAERALPFVDAYDVRHLLCAFTGVAGIAAVWVTARLIAGPRAGAIAAVTLAVSGSWYGSMFNHTKDIPLAAAMTGATFFLIRAMRDLPTPRRRDILCFGLLLGAALGIRVLALLLVGYVAFAIIARTMERHDTLRDWLEFFARSAIAFVPAFVIGYAIMIAAWPWSALAPLNPLRGLIDFSEFNYQINTLFNGHIYQMGNVPRWYVPGYLLIKLPLIMLIGAAVAAALALLLPRPGADGRRRRQETLLLALFAIFPVLAEVIDRGPAFTGLRHFLFVVPFFAILAGIGFDDLVTWLAARRRIVADAACAVIAGLLLWNAVTLVRLHPYEYLYYNTLVGGLEGASGRFATDYWVNIMPEAVGDLEAYVRKLDTRGDHTQRYTVAVCGERLPFEKEADSRLQWTEDWTKAEFFIAPTHMNCDRALDGQVITTISRLGARIGVVKDRRALVRPEIARSTANAPHR